MANSGAPPVMMPPPPVYMTAHYGQQQHRPPHHHHYHHNGYCCSCCISPEIRCRRARIALGSLILVCCLVVLLVSVASLHLHCSGLSHDPGEGIWVGVFCAIGAIFSIVVGARKQRCLAAAALVMNILGVHVAAAGLFTALGIVQERSQHLENLRDPTYWLYDRCGADGLDDTTAFFNAKTANVAFMTVLCVLTLIDCVVSCVSFSRGGCCRSAVQVAPPPPHQAVPIYYVPYNAAGMPGVPPQPLPPAQPYPAQPLPPAQPAQMMPDHMAAQQHAFNWQFQQPPQMPYAPYHNTQMLPPKYPD